MSINRTRLERFLPHILGILVIVLLPLFGFDRDNPRYSFWMHSYYFQLAFMFVAFYINFLVIVPKLYFRKKRIWFFLVLFLFAILMLSLFQLTYNLIDFDALRATDIQEFKRPIPRSRFGLHPRLIDNFSLILLVLGFSTGMAIMQRQKHNETKHKEIEKARMDTELAFLKNQISPHFFFNSLNNIYALIAIDGPKAQLAVEKLSGLMRYLIYESDTKMIDLRKEFEFTCNYIDLMRQRLTSKVKLDVDIILNVPDVKIPPLIFIPFIENAFKHGVSYREPSHISIGLKAEKNSIVFECINSIAQQKEQDAKKEGGVGIQNIKKRLELIYGEAAELSMLTENSTFNVHLVLPIVIEV
jgi:sensor histidine kinase YesM